MPEEQNLDTSVDQGMYAEDFFSDDKDLVFQDGGSLDTKAPQSDPAPANQNQPQYQQQQNQNPNQGQPQQQNNVNQNPQAQNQQVNQQQQMQQQPQQGNQQQQQQAPANQPSEFDYIVNNEDGSQQFDANQAFQSIFPNDNVLKPVYQPPAQQPINQQQAQHHVEPAKDPNVEYRENFESNLKSFYSIYKGYVNQGYDHQVAETLAEKDMATFIGNHMQERARTEYQKSMDERINAKLSELETAKLKPSSVDNLNQIVFENSWGSSKQLETAMLSPDIGGDLLMAMHGIANPDKSYSSAEEYSSDLQKFYIKATSDIRTAKMLEKYSRAMIFMRNKDRFSGHVNNNKANEQTHNKRTTRRSASYTRNTNFRQPRSQSSMSDVDNFFKDIT